MDRRESIKTMFLGSVFLPFMKNEEKGEHLSKQPESTGLARVSENHLESPWQRMPDMTWTGSEFWANRLQDWRVQNGELQCLIRAKDRSLYCLTHQLDHSRNRFQTTAHIALDSNTPVSDENHVGFRLGAQGRFQDYRSAAIYGKGLDVGVTTSGHLFIGEEQSKHQLASGDLHNGFILDAQVEPRGMNYALLLTAFDEKGEKELDHLEIQTIKPERLEGNVGLISDFQETSVDNREGPSFWVRGWRLNGSKLDYNTDQTFGPIYFAQYTQHHGKLRLTAQLAPVPRPAKAHLELKEGNSWKRVQSADIDYPAYTARFSMDNWNYRKEIPYRVVYIMDLKDGSDKMFTYEGSIAKEPIDKPKLKALVSSCNGDMGFPDQEVVDHASMHNADVVMFLGDQFYEGNGRFGVEREPVEKAYLDYLRKWYQFGWSYRELFRHRPSIFLPDDHDIFQGNVWGQGGKEAVNTGSQKFQQDSGGYTQPAKWVNLVMDTQTSHMPDPYDPEPIKQGIHVFYTDWKYAGVSFGIIEDRKFKTAPKNILPESADVINGYAENQQFDVSAHTYPDAELIGERQLNFLNDWIEDWSRQTEFKVLVSATTFQALQTLPEGTKNDTVTPGLDVPQKGEYVQGDAPTQDMDTDGWPMSKRDEVIRVIRKAFALHLGGDQHLASISKYGVDDFGDAGFVFTVPALGNIWPRRWWPPVPANHDPIRPGAPAYTGNFRDGFNNPMQVYAAANPRKRGLEPEILYDRSTGYGVVTFDKETREAKLECYPRFVNPKRTPNKQYEGWPLTVQQRDNYNPSNTLVLPTLVIDGMDNPVVKVRDQDSGELVQVLRIKGNRHQPKVLKKGTYDVEIGEPGTNRIKHIKDLEPLQNGEGKEINVSV